MKTPYLLAAVLVAGLGFSHAASASTFTVTSEPTLYEVTGSLSKDTEITFTYNGNASPGSFLSVVGQESTVTGNNMLTEASFATSASSPSSNSGSSNVPGGTLMVLTAAAIKGMSSITIENLTSAAVNFSALFAATNLASAGNFSTNGPSTVPLPPAFTLFATGLLALGGFAAYRKAHNRA